MNAPVITTPEATNEGLVAPGQEELYQQILAEEAGAPQAEPPAEPEMLLGKFKSVDDLTKAYQELERKLGQPKEAEPEPQQVQPYTREQSITDYGEALTDAFETAQVNPYEIAAKLAAGEPADPFVTPLAEATGFPPAVVSQYLQSFQPKGEAQGEASQLSDADMSALKESVGGDQAFQQLSSWAVSNLSAEDLTSYNAVVDSGNRDAIRWALKALQAQAGQTSQVQQPKLISGGTPAKTSRFESQQQVLDAMNKTNDRGQRLYDVDDAYRAKFEQMLAISDVFG